MSCKFAGNKLRDRITQRRSFKAEAAEELSKLLNPNEILARKNGIKIQHYQRISPKLFRFG